MSAGFDDAALAAMRHYLDRAAHILTRLCDRDDRNALLATRLTPDGFDLGFHFAVAIQFAARGLCPPVGRAIPSVPEDCNCDTLLAFAKEVDEAISAIRPEEMTGSITHDAGNVKLELDAADHVLRFAFPNMLFHLSMAYAILRQEGMNIGKADFDGLHVY